MNIKVIYILLVCVHFESCGQTSNHHCTEHTHSMVQKHRQKCRRQVKIYQSVPVTGLDIALLYSIKSIYSCKQGASRYFDTNLLSVGAKVSERHFVNFLFCIFLNRSTYKYVENKVDEVPYGYLWNGATRVPFREHFCCLIVWYFIPFSNPDGTC